MNCENCRLWTAPKGEGIYGLCKPGSELPFWARKPVKEMQTYTNRKEGGNCFAFQRREDAVG